MAANALRLRPPCTLRPANYLRLETSAHVFAHRRSVGSSGQERWRNGEGQKVCSSSEEQPVSLGTSTLAETAALDELIDLLLGCKHPNDLAARVAENVMSFDQRFWLRLATRADTATSEEERKGLSDLAKVVMQLVDAMVQKTNNQLSNSAAVLQDILKAAADEETGEWTVPLPPNKLKAMEAAMEERAEHLDEALLSNCFAWMRKASDDNLDGMVSILQKVLQLYAARALGKTEMASTKQEGSSNSDADSVITELLASDEARWAENIREKALNGEISEVSFMEALQRRMEGVVLGLPSGSYTQRVQAEYLKELEERSKTVFQDLARRE